QASRIAASARKGRAQRRYPAIAAAPQRLAIRTMSIRDCGTTQVGGDMVAELNILTEWIPEQMQPGTVFVLENAGEVGKNEDPYWAVLACPECGTLGLITRRQMAGITPVICGSEKCSAHFFIRDEDVQVCKPN